MKRFYLMIQGEANALALFDVLHGSNVHWTEPKHGTWHRLEFDAVSLFDAGEHITACFPDMRGNVREVQS